jgi:hypothetical protein
LSRSRLRTPPPEGLTSNVSLGTSRRVLTVSSSKMYTSCGNLGELSVPGGRSPKRWREVPEGAAEGSIRQIHVGVEGTVLSVFARPPDRPCREHRGSDDDRLGEIHYLPVGPTSLIAEHVEGRPFRRCRAAPSGSPSPAPSALAGRTHPRDCGVRPARTDHRGAGRGRPGCGDGWLLRRASEHGVRLARARTRPAQRPPCPDASRRVDP